MTADTHKQISDKYCPRFGQTAVEKGYISAERLKDAVNIQIDEEISGQKHRLLGTILFEKNWMTGDQIETVLNLLLKQMRNEKKEE